MRPECEFALGCLADREFTALFEAPGSRDRNSAVAGAECSFYGPRF
tara:strand:+ start:674 stop:811 length:138 start_codon:yes stop_codon:yes gene_type:complete